MRKIISLICIVLPILASADELAVRDNAPDKYQVVKGDTLWGISAKFFKDPWKWPQIWGLNKDSIKDPHWIYPGDVVFLDAASKTLHIGQPIVLPQAASGVAQATGTGVDLVPGIDSDHSNVEKLHPKARVVKEDAVAIPSVSSSTLLPLLKKPLVIEEDQLDGSPVIVGAPEKRALVSKSDKIYVKNLPVDKGESWQIYEPGKEFIDPETGESLGYEVVYLGDAYVEQYADISTLRVTNSVLEIRSGDRLVQPTVSIPDNYIPRPPKGQVNARVISFYGGVEEGGKTSVITLNKGERDGIENGNVLALYHKGEDVVAGNSDEQLPDIRYGLVFIFRTFEKVSYGLVVEASMPVELLDRAVTP